MLLGFSRTRYLPIGVDFGADSLKLLQVLPGDPPKLVAAASMPMPESVRANPSARHAFYTDAIKQLLQSHPFKGRKAILSLPSYQTLIQHVQIQRAEKQSEIDDQLGNHLRERLNVDPSRMVIRHFECINGSRESSGKMNVICIAAGREVVMRHIESAHRAKLDVVGMHAEPQAILKAFGHLYRRDADAARTTCFIDIGCATTKVLITHGIGLVFAKTIHAGGDHLTRACAQMQGVSFTDARALRIREALNPPSPASQDPPAKAPAIAAKAEVEPAAPRTSGFALIDSQMQAEEEAAPDTATATAAPAPSPRAASRPAPAADPTGETLDCIIEELRMCARFHQSLHPDRKIEKLVFLGGESNNVSICQRVARALGIGAQLGDPLARMVKTRQPQKEYSLDMRRPQPGWAVPLGLCLSETNL